MSKGYTITRLPDLPAIHVLYEEPRDNTEELSHQIAREIDPMLTGIQGKLFRINDFTPIYDLPIFTKVMRVLPQELTGTPGTSSDPRLISIFVGQGQALSLIVQGLEQDQYGNRKTKLFPTLDEALEYIRAKVAERAARNSNAA